GLDLLPPEWEMLAMVDGQRDLRTIASELGRWDFEVAKTLFGLESAGLVALVDPGTVKRERSSITSDLAELVARAEDAVERRELGGRAGAARRRARREDGGPNLGRCGSGAAWLTRSRRSPPSSPRIRTAWCSCGWGSCSARRASSTRRTASHSPGSSGTRTSRTRTTCTRASSPTSATTSAPSTNGT